MKSKKQGVVYTLERQLPKSRVDCYAELFTRLVVKLQLEGKVRLADLLRFFGPFLKFT